jgi:predicted transcriptional regulator
MGREVAESNRGLKHHYWHRELEEHILHALHDGPLTLHDLSAAFSVSKQRAAWALSHLITKGYVVAVRRGRSLRFEKVPGSLIEFILEHEV